MGISPMELQKELAIVVISSLLVRPILARIHGLVSYHHSTLVSCSFKAADIRGNLSRWGYIERGIA